MGYTHYWYRPFDIPADVFQTIRSDFERIVLPLADYGVHLGAGLGEDLPLFTDDYICFKRAQILRTSGEQGNWNSLAVSGCLRYRTKRSRHRRQFQRPDDHD